MCKFKASQIQTLLGQLKCKYYHKGTNCVCCNNESFHVGPHQWLYMAYSCAHIIRYLILVETRLAVWK